MKTTLAMTYHDPDGRLVLQIQRCLATFQKLFSAVVVNASHAASPQGLKLLQDAGVLITQNTAQDDLGPPRIGRSRRKVVTRAAQSGAETVLYCDFDRALHWAEFFPDELEYTASTIQSYDLTVLGRTPRAFRTHPRFQIDTETIINHIFSLAYGKTWDITAGARGLSRHAVKVIAQESTDDGLSTDMSWPLLLASKGYFKLGYLEADGLEYETADRYPEQVFEMGGLESFRANLETDPERWVNRLALALEEAQAVLPFVNKTIQGPRGPFDNLQD